MNKINFVFPKEVPEKCDNAFFVEIDGKTIQSENDWLYTMAEKFHFPVNNGRQNICWFKGAFEYPRKRFMNWNRYQDGITDLEWLNTNSVILIIYNYKYFMKNYHEAKTYIMNDLENTLNFWENDAGKHIVGGQRKDFNIYVIDME